MRNLIIGFIVGVILILGALLVVSQDTYSGDVWEYQTFVVIDTASDAPQGAPLITIYQLNGEILFLDTPEPLYAVLNSFGEGGWEYVGTHTGDSDGYIGSRGGDMIFKRKVVD